MAQVTVGGSCYVAKKVKETWADVVAIAECIEKYIEEEITRALNSAKSRKRPDKP